MKYMKHEYSIYEYSRKMEKFKSLLCAPFEFPIEIEYYDVDKRYCATLQFVLGSYKNKNHSKALNSVIAGYEKRRSRKKNSYETDIHVPVAHTRSQILFVFFYTVVVS